MKYHDYSINILIDTIDDRLKNCIDKEYFIVEHKILNEENKISEITIHTHESEKINIATAINEIKKYMEQNYNLTIIRNKNIKQDKILKDTYEIKILTINKYIGE